MRLLLDTHTVVHHSQRSSHFREEIYELIDNLQNEIFLSAATAGELACLAARNRINLGEPWADWLKRILANNPWTCLPITVEIMIEAFSLSDLPHNDPADRIFVATARLHDLTLVTADGLIRKYSGIKTIG